MKETWEDKIDSLIDLELKKARLDDQRDQIMSSIELTKAELRALARQRPKTFAAATKSPPAARAVKADKLKSAAKAKVKAKGAKRGARASVATENLLKILRVQGAPQSVADLRGIFDTPNLSQKLHTLTKRGDVKKVGTMGSYKYVYNARNGVAPATAVA